MTRTLHVTIKPTDHTDLEERLKAIDGGPDATRCEVDVRLVVREPLIALISKQITLDASRQIGVARFPTVAIAAGIFSFRNSKPIVLAVRSFDVSGGYLWNLEGPETDVRAGLNDEVVPC